MVGHGLTGLQLAYRWVNASVLRWVAERCHQLEYVSFLDMREVERVQRNSYHWFDFDEDGTSGSPPGFEVLDVIDFVKACRGLK